MYATPLQTGLPPGDLEVMLASYPTGPKQPRRPTPSVPPRP